MSEERLLTPRQLSQRIGFAVSTLKNWRCEKKGPKWKKFGNGHVRYRLADIEAWEKAQ
jgi:predicted DNA-binding transcriptional regulator AlpA